MTITRTILTVTIALLSASAWTAAESSGKKPPTKPTKVVKAAPPRSIPIPITLARSGQQTEILLLPIRGWRLIKKEVVLIAFGRVWFGPADVSQTSAATRTTMTVPNVRVPTVFSVVDRSKRVVGELVAYPARNVEWDENILLYSAGVPQWFNQWADATGLPVKKVNLAEFKAVNRQKPNDKKHLLIIGRGATGHEFANAIAIAKKHKINVLVLEAAWFGSKSDKVTVQPKQMAGGLAALRKQKWSKPLIFGSHALPWQGIANRWAWISDKEGLPLVEEIGDPTTSPRRVVLNYTPWYKQLGRREEADATLHAILRNAARQTTRHWKMADVLWPKLVDIKTTTRPILSAAIKTWPITSAPPARVHILDLRGGKAPPQQLLKRLNELEKLKTNNKFHFLTPLLILGDDPMLDEWKWAKIDRKKMKSRRADVTWVPDDSPPPSKKQQIRLIQIRLMQVLTEKCVKMQVLTEKCVRIWQTSKKEKNRETPAAAGV
ncbi:MAG: hypothetical protein K8S55_13240 [Phycisphaerae bacterium]|nr:hypothetical protein [Phycisphaerae bacterium]